MSTKQSGDKRAECARALYVDTHSAPYFRALGPWCKKNGWTSFGANSTRLVNFLLEKGYVSTTGEKGGRLYYWNHDTVPAEWREAAGASVIPKSVVTSSPHEPWNVRAERAIAEATNNGQTEVSPITARDALVALDSEADVYETLKDLADGGIIRRDEARNVVYLPKADRVIKRVPSELELPACLRKDVGEARPSPPLAQSRAVAPSATSRGGHGDEGLRHDIDQLIRRVAMLEAQNTELSRAEIARALAQVKKLWQALPEFCRDGFVAEIDRWLRTVRSR